MYDTVFSEGAWRVRDPDGRISAVGFRSEGKAGRMASDLNTARALHFRVMGDNTVTIRRYNG